VVDQFVIHYDASGTSRQCFRTLHDVRGLSVHFMLDIDGTIYQTLDVKERAWHATTSNDRSVGVEIANIGAYPPEAAGVLDRWYREGHLTIPPEYGDGGVRTPAFLGAPIRAGPVTGVTQGRTLVQYDLTPQQYDSLIKLTATLCTVLPGIECNYPRDAHGDAFPDKLPDDRLGAYRGLLGHYHIQQDKADPGPAFQWERVIEGARALVGTPPG
jgi:N-acetyl-anhydromuramyl-L-alanine amidase AmpD